MLLRRALLGERLKAQRGRNGLTEAEIAARPEFNGYGLVYLVVLIVKQ